jgi:hypothetical protein
MDSKILELLRSTRFPPDRRRGVRTSNKDPKLGFMLGAVVSYSHGYRLSTMTRKNMDLARLLVKWMKAHHPGFHFTSIQVNKGGSALHVDRSNCGTSVVKGFGRHTGGKLWSMESPRKFRSVARGRGHVIDGNVPHMNAAHKGERYSVVFFRFKANRAPMPRDQMKIYRGLGFPDMARGRQSCTLPAKRSLPEACRILRALGIPMRQIGDFRNMNITRR